MVRLYKTVKKFFRTRRAVGRVRSSKTTASTSKKVSPIQALPLELFYAIVAELPEVDKQCLRITCRSFRSLILPLTRTDDIEDDEVALVQRLIVPGNVFHGRDEALCFSCYKIKDNSRFPMPALRLMSGPICENCIATSVRRNWQGGYEVTNAGVELYVCKTCKFALFEDQGRVCKNTEHDGDRDGMELYQRICTSCCKQCKEEKERIAAAQAEEAVDT